MEDWKVRLVSDRKEWEEFVKREPAVNFLQSWNWGEFHRNLGKKIFRFGLYREGELHSIALAVKETARRGTYFAIAGGPVPFEGQETKRFIEEIEKVAMEEQCDFIRLRPQERNTSESRALAKEIGLAVSPMHLTADLTLQLDITMSEDEIISKMRKSTRYEIRRAKKMNVEVRGSKNPEDIKTFYNNQVKLAKKQGFTPFPYKFLYEQFRSFVADDKALLFHAYKDDELLASAFVIFYNGEAVYHYGVSTPANNRIPGSYACLWEAILEAKRRDCERFNLWGVAPKDETRHRFASLSVFKRGFGGEEVEYLPAHDLPLTPRYKAIRIFEIFRKRLRRV